MISSSMRTLSAARVVPVASAAMPLSELPDGLLTERISGFLDPMSALQTAWTNRATAEAPTEKGPGIMADRRARQLQPSTGETEGPG